MLVAGADSSVRGCTVVVVDAATGEVVRTGRAPHPPGTEADPEAWWTSLCAALAQAGGLDDVAAISIAAERHAPVPLDGLGRVVRDAPLGSARSAAAAHAAAQLVAEFGAETLARRTGSVPSAAFPIAKLRGLRNTEPARADQVAAVALPHDWLTWRLLGYGPDAVAPSGAQLEALATDRSDASGTGYYSPTLNRYDRGLLVAALGHDVTLPRVLAPGEAAGRTVAGLEGVPAGIVVGPGAGADAAAALGLGLAPGDVVVSLGASGAVFALTTTATADATGTVAGFASASGEHLPLVATPDAALVLDRAAGLLGVDRNELGRLALDAPPGAGGLALVPDPGGAGRPDAPTAAARLTATTLAGTTRPAFARAAIEGMLCGLADGLDALLALGVPAARILLLGDAARPAVSSIAATVFPVPVAVPAPTEYVARGAAAQAAWTLTRRRPAWPVDLLQTEPADPHPEIRAAHRAAAAAYRPS